MIFLKSNWWEERESNQNNKGAPQLTTLLLQNTGKLVFPIYNIIRTRKIFRSREDLLQFECACGLESDLSDLINEKNFQEAKNPIKVIIHQFGQILANEETSTHVKSLPRFLRKFTSGSVLAFALTRGVDVYERLKHHDLAVEVLKKLLAQTLYLPDYHGLGMKDWHWLVIVWTKLTTTFLY